jgi:hypothetical protein
MKTKSQRRRHIQNGLARAYRGLLLRAEIGKLEDDGTYTVFVDQAQNLIYARLTDDHNKLIVTYNLRVKNRAELAIWVRETDDGLEVEGVRGKRASEFLGEAAPSMNLPEIIGALMNTVISSRNYEPGRVRLYAADSLILHVEPFWYRYFGKMKRWPGGTIDMTDYLPATTNYWRWALVCLWGNGDELVVLVGDETNAYTALTDTTLATICEDIDTLIPLDAVRLQEGSTTIERDTQFQHARLLSSDVGLGGVPSEVTSPYLHIPEWITVKWPDTLVITTGTLTVDGTLTV